MEKLIFQLLNSFSPLFSRKMSFVWFIVVIFGFLLRFDHYGVSSFVRWLYLPASTYPLLLNFFHATSWSLGEVMLKWMDISQNNFELVSHNGRLIVAGDGIKIPKESKSQPGLKYMHGSSGNQTKKQRFIGHHFGCIAFIAEKYGQFRAILQVAQLHEGVDYAYQTPEETPQPPDSIVANMLLLLIIIAKKRAIPFYAVLDAFFSTSTAFRLALHNLQENGQTWVHLLIPAKKNYVAYPSASQSKTERIKIFDLFKDLALFTEHPHPLHPERTVKLYSRDLYWGKENFFLRFIWVIDGTDKFVLMSTDLLLSPLLGLKFYGLRFKIEFAFLTLKHYIGGFCYRFWSSLCKYNDKKQSVIVTDKEHEKAVATKILEKLMVIERFVNLAIIAQGVLNYVAFAYTEWVWRTHRMSSWLRSYSSCLPSEEVTQRALQAYFLTSFSLQMVKDFVYSTKKLALPDKSPKVRKNDTLRHFLTSSA